MTQYAISEAQTIAARSSSTFLERRATRGAFSLFGPSNTVVVGARLERSSGTEHPDDRARDVQAERLALAPALTPVYATPLSPESEANNSGQLKGRITGPVQVLQRIADEWQLSTTELAKLLAYPNAQFITDVLDGQMSLRDQDREDRVRLLFRIYRVLTLLFADPHRQQDWLRSPNESLGNKSPLVFMMERRIPGMVSVQNLVERFAGR